VDAETHGPPDKESLREQFYDLPFLTSCPGRRPAQHNGGPEPPSALLALPSPDHAQHKEQFWEARGHFFARAMRARPSGRLGFPLLGPRLRTLV
jgi:hypothetical protein